MISRRALGFFLPAAFAALSACAPSAVVVLGPDYDPSRIRRVTLASFSDYPGAPGSGDIVAGTFEKYLLTAGYRLVERRQAEQILKEHDFSLSGEVSPDQAREAGKLLGVDAIALGQLTDFTDTRDQTVMVDMPQEQIEPIYGEVVTTQRNGDAHVRTRQTFVSGYATTQTSQIVPQTQTVPARVGLAVRLVDVETGEVLWSASASASGDSLPSAAEEASSAAMREVAKQVRKRSK